MYSSQRPGNEHPPREYAPHSNTSPTQTPSHAYSPTDRANRPRIPSFSRQPQSPQYNRSHPSSPSASRVPLPAPLSQPRERPSSGYYDPTSDSRERIPEYQPPQYQPRSPIQVSQSPLVPQVLCSPADELQPRNSMPHNDRYAESNGYHHDDHGPRSRAASRSGPQEPYAHAHPTNNVNGREEPAIAPPPMTPNVCTPQILCFVLLTFIDSLHLEHQIQCLS